ncbi:MAG TPA: inositol monophosphatase [Candidatus Paceibacterota bacterium]|jgi:fructose-1,6-bisphosphatase/inositol monophosphatase family enzyme|nr:inositol monophosphatase [Candidatus Paceibacterota bacterium]
MTYHDFAVELVRKAGEHLKKVRPELLDITFKEDDPRNLLTNADIEIDQMMHEQILQAFPDHRIYSEEDASAKQADAVGFVWTLDPIDGTSNFSRGLPLFSSCATLLENGVPIVGAIYSPIMDELYSFDVHTGAFLNGRPIKTSSITELSKATGLLHIGRKEPLWNWGLAVKRSFLESLSKSKDFAASALEMAFLAAGRVDIVVYGTFSSQDMAGAIGLVRAAGGEVYNMQGAPVAITPVSQTIVATANKELFEKILPLLHRDLLLQS